MSDWNVIIHTAGRPLAGVQVDMRVQPVDVLESIVQVDLDGRQQNIKRLTIDYDQKAIIVRVKGPHLTLVKEPS